MSDPSQVQEITVTTPGVFPREVLAGTVPVLVRGMISHWPSVVAASASDRDLLDYLRSLQRDAPILAFRGAPDEGGRFFYNDDLTGFNFQRVSTTLGRFLERMAAQEVEDHAYIGSSTVEDYFPGFNEQNTLDLGVATPLVSIWIVSICWP